MNNNRSQKNCLYISGFNGDVDRRSLITEFNKFGRVNRLYIEPTGQFARVFYDSRQSAERALNELNNSLLNWQVTLENTSQYNYNKSESSMAHYDEYDDEFTESMDYCNVHGQPLTVLLSDGGDLFVNLKDIRKTGFALFRKDTFDSVLVDNRQIGKEFELHLLSEAKNYILKNRVASIDEDQILKTIESCKKKLLGENNKNHFGAGRTVAQGSGNITITSSVQPTYDGFHMSEPEQSQSRPPKSLPNNFMATHTQRADRSKGFNAQDQQQGQRGKTENSWHNGANTNTNSKSESDLNSSISSETRSKFTSPKSGFEPVKRAQKSQTKEKLPRIAFEQGTVYEIQVSYKEKESIYWVQDKSLINDLEKIILEVDELAKDLDPINPEQGQLVAAEYAGIWNRGRVISVEPLMVHFVDYGNKSGVDLVKALPDSLKTTPALAARVAIDASQEVSEEMDLKVRIKRKYDDGTYVVEVLNNNNYKRDADIKPSQFKSVAHSSNVSKENLDVLVEKPSTSKEHLHTPKQTSYFDIPKPMSEICSGDKVMLIDTEANKFLVKTKECALKSKEVTEYIKNLDKSTLVLTNVKVGQLVLCSRDGYLGLFRGVITKKDSDLIVTVKYVDFPGEADLSLKSLRNVDEFLANEPSSILITPVYKYLEDVTEKAAEYISTICQNKQKFTVVLSKDDFDLQAEDGTLLSQTLHDLETPEKPVTVKASTSTPKKTEVKTETVAERKPATVIKEKILYEEMDWMKMEPGLHRLMCYCLQDLDDITFISSDDNVIRYLETITAADPTDQEPYNPEASEMCLVSFKGPEDDEASWYRAVVLEVEEDGYFVNFVDFGNMEKTQSKDIRKFPADLKDIPILGIGCECIGVPRKPEILERLKELMREGDEVDVLIKEFEDLKYRIELPELYKKLKAEKLF